MKRIALAGVGHIHTPAFIRMLGARRAEIEVTGVWDDQPERAARRAAELETRVYPAAAAIWDDPAVDAVVIAAETDRHRELVPAAAAAGKHLFVEKPLAASAADALAMADAVRRAGVLFQTGYFMRGEPVNRFLKQQIAAGAFGTITRMRHVNCHAGSLKGWFDTEWRWMADPRRAGCGAFGDLGTHSLDLLLWFAGAVPERVTAQVRTVTGRYGAACDECGEGMLAFASGMLATLAGGWVDTACPVRCEISGTEGHATVVNGALYFQSDRVPGADGKTPWTELPLALPHAFELFLDAVCGRPAELVSVEEAAQRSVVMAAMYAAAAAGVWTAADGR